ncbi:uncharacterized [Tachysurus ichikawai]
MSKSSVFSAGFVLGAQSMAGTEALCLCRLNRVTACSTVSMAPFGQRKLSCSSTPHAFFRPLHNVQEIAGKT